MPKGVQVPSAGGIKGAFADFAYGTIGGGVYGVTTAVLGSGFLGLVAAPLVAGSIVKGTRGTAISTIAGFLATAALLSGGGASEPSGSSAEVM